MFGEVALWALLKGVLQSPWSLVPVVALSPGAASGYSCPIPLSNPGQPHALLDSSTFAETTTPMPLHPGTVHSPSSSQDTDRTPTCPPRPPSLLPLPTPHGPARLSCVSMELRRLSPSNTRSGFIPRMRGQKQERRCFPFPLGIQSISQMTLPPNHPHKHKTKQNKTQKTSVSVLLNSSPCYINFILQTKKLRLRRVPWADTCPGWKFTDMPSSPSTSSLGPVWGREVGTALVLCAQRPKPLPSN